MVGNQGEEMCLGKMMTQDRSSDCGEGKDVSRREMMAQDRSSDRGNSCNAHEGTRFRATFLWPCAVVVGALAAAFPRLATTTVHVAMPSIGVTGLFAPTFVLAVGILLAVWDRTGGCAMGGRHAWAVHVLCLALSVSFIAFELACLHLRGALPDWNYVSVAPWMRGLELGWGTLCLLLLTLVSLLPSVGGAPHCLAARPRQASVPMLALCLASGFVIALSSMGTAAGGGVSEDARPAVVTVVVLCRSLWAVLATLLVPLSPESLEGRWLPWGSLLSGYALGAVVRASIEGAWAGYTQVGPTLHLLLLAISLALLAVALVPGMRAARRDARPCVGGEVMGLGQPLTPYEEMLVELSGAGDLSGRERQVILMALSGRPTSAIAAALHVSEATVSSYRGRAYRKLKVGSLTELVARVRPSRRVASAAGPEQPPSPDIRRVVVLALVPCAALATSLCLGDYGVAVSSLVACAMTAVGIFLLHRARREPGRDARGAEAVIALGSLCALANTCAMSNGPVDPASTLASYLALGAAGVLALFAVRDRRHVALSDAMLAHDERPRLYLLGRGLTRLEASVSVLTAEGVPASGIASHLHVALPTIYSYRARSLKKLGIHGRGQLLELLRREAGMG